MPAIQSVSLDGLGITMVDFVGTRRFLFSSLTAPQLATTTAVENAITLWASGLANLPYNFGVRCRSVAPLDVVIVTGADAAAVTAALARIG